MNDSDIKNVELKIQKRVLELERHNYKQKEFSQTIMVDKIKKIIEEESKKC